jgi:hypothetical protein
LESNIKSKWYRTTESKESKTYILGPHIKFILNSSWVEKSRESTTGAADVVGRGIKKISLESILNRSAKI